MTALQAGPPLPTLPGLHWRLLAPTDLPAIAALTERCQLNDGGMPMAAEASYIQSHYLNGAPTTSGTSEPQGHPAIGAFDLDERLVACAAVTGALPADGTATIVGQVHPRQRGRGLGRFLLEWSIAEARELLGGQGRSAGTLKIATESLTEPAARLYERYGFAAELVEDVMRFDVKGGIPDAPLPAGVALAPWAPSLAQDFFAAYQASFRDRPGFPNWGIERWTEWVSGGDEFCAAASWLASRQADGRPVGFIVCDDAWITQVGVAPAQRGGGLGAALIVAALRHFAAAGHKSAMLDVNANNPGAAALYRRLGFATVGHRARYARGAE